MNKEKIKKTAYFVLAGLVSPLIFEPCSEIIKNAGNGIFSSCIDYFYVSCANSSGTKVILGFVHSLYIFIIFYFIINISNLLFNSQKREKESTNNVDNASASNTKIVVKNNGKKSKRLLWFLVIYFVIFLITNTAYEYLPVIYRENFNKDIIQITPYVEEKEIDVLFSKWVSMETKSDYDAIYARISEIKQENNLK